MASTDPKTGTDAAPASSPKSTDKASEAPKVGPEPKTSPTSAPKPADKALDAPMAGTEQKTETEAPPTSTPKSTVNAPPEAPITGTEPKTETEAPPTSTPKPAVNAPEIKTVEVGNISIAVTKKEVWEFFIFSGDIHYIEMKRESDATQQAFVTFKDPQGADTAVLLTGATIADLSVSVSHVENYQLPPDAPPLTTKTQPPNEVAQKAEEVVSTMLAKGFVLGKDALQKAKSFDEKHQLTSNASAKVASLDQKMGLTEKLTMGTAKMKEVNERYQVSEKASNAKSAIMSNQYVSSGAVWLSGAFAAVAKAAEGVGSKTKEKVEKAEEEKKEALSKAEEDKKEDANKEGTTTDSSTGNEQAPLQVDKSSIAGSPCSKSSNADDASKK